MRTDLENKFSQAGLFHLQTQELVTTPHEEDMYVP